MCDRLAIEQILDNLVSNAIKYGAGQPIMVTASEEPSLHQLIVEVRDGVRLLHRTTRSVQLTEHGRAFHARARDLLAEVDDLHSMFAGDSVALRGRLRVDLPTEVARNESKICLQRSKRIVLPGRN